MDVKELLLKVKADLGSVKEATSGINKSIGGMMTDIKGKVSGGMSSVSKAVKKVGTVAAATTTAAIGVAGAITGVAIKASGTADEIDKMSQKIGLSKRGYQEWSYVMNQNGMDINTMQTGMKTLVGQVDKVVAGNKDAIANFEGLGLSVTDANGKLKDQETIMNESLAALANMENGTEKARLATELFGKAGSEMMPMLNQGAGAMDDLKKRANDLGIIMSDDAVSSGVALGDMMDDVKKSFGAMATKLGTAIMPILSEVITLILDSMPMITDLFNTLTPILQSAFSELLPPLIEMSKSILPVIVDLISTLLPTIVEIITDVLPIITELLMALIPFVVEIVKTLLPPLLDIVKALLPVLKILIDALKPILDIFIALLKPILEIIVSAITPLINIVGKLIGVALKPLITVVGSVVKLFTENLSVAIEGVKGLIDGLKKVFGGLIDFITGVFTGDWKKAFGGLGDIVSGIFEGLVSIIKAPLNILTNGLNFLIRGANKIKIDVPKWVPGIGGKSIGFNIPEIPKLADGAVIGPNNPFLAMLGDQTSGINIETPLETMLDAFKAALSEMNYSGNNSGGTSGGLINQGIIISNNKNFEALWEIMKQFMIRDGYLSNPV